MELSLSPSKIARTPTLNPFLTLSIFLPFLSGRLQKCYLPMSPSTGSPILAGDSDSGIYLSAGHSCWGITLSLGTGLCMAELILEGKVQSADVDELVA